jgi:GDPmannose 4,6-dehydratase
MRPRFWFQQTAMTKIALITGITGQDGSYLAEHLLRLGYDVHGLVRRVALPDQRIRLHRIAHVLDRLTLHSASLESYASILQVLSRVRFDECYHLAAQSYVAESFANSFSTMNTNVNGTHYLLEALRQLQPGCRFYFAASSEMFGNCRESPQHEDTLLCPRSPYAISKVAGFHLTRNYREAYGLFCCNGILFNHESPRRGMEFVTRKISRAAACIKRGLARELRLGNLEARRDWGHAEDYVRAMHLILQQPEPEDFVVASGSSHSVREFCELAFAQVGLDCREYVIQDDQFRRPADVQSLVGNAAKARRQLRWQAERCFQELVAEMVETDLRKTDASSKMRVSRRRKCRLSK